MGLEAATYIDEFVVTNPVGGDPRSEGDNHLRLLKAAIKNTFPGMAGRAWRVQAKGSGYTVIATDNMTVIRCTAAITVALTAAATLGNGFLVLVEATSGDVILDPAAAELVNGAATATIPSGAKALVWCDGAAFYATFNQELGGTISGGNLSFTGATFSTGVISPAQITANTNDYAPAGLSGASVLRINSDARRNLTGLTGGAAGRRLTIHNVGTFPIPFKREDVLSTAANRFVFGCSLGGGQALEIEYDATSSRWRARALPEPIGTIKDFGGGTVPEDFVACDGAAISRTTYASYFNEVGTVWGVGDGSTTVNVPDFRDKAAIGDGTGTSVATGVDADVDITANEFVVPSNTRKWTTGMKVNFTLSSGTITGLTGGNDYYVIRMSATRISLASTLANAQNGAEIDFTAKSSPVWTLTHTYEARTLGEYGGEEGHAMSSSENLLHTHVQDAHTHTQRGGASDGSTAGLAGSGTAGNGTFVLNQISSSVAATNQNTGGNAAMNIMSPFGVVNKIIRVF